MTAPKYYLIPTRGKTHIQPWDISVELHHSYPRGAALKYLLRAGNKPGNAAVDDLRKAVRSIEREIEAIEADTAARLAKVLAPKQKGKGKG